MKLAIMQPYFCPYLGYFSLIKYADHFVLLDEVQFIRHGWIERNRIINHGGGSMYIKVPIVKSRRETLIKNISIKDKDNWREKIYSQVGIYRRRAPYYWKILELLKEGFSLNTSNITELNAHLLSVICRYLGFEFKYSIFSNMGIDIETMVTAPDEWALCISKEFSADIYVNPAGGQSIFDRSKYDRCGIEIEFLEMQQTSYNQRNKEFQPWLSIIDVMMFNSSPQVNLMLDRFELT